MTRKFGEKGSAGGFNFRKFFSYYKSVLMSTLESHRRKTIKNSDLVNEEMPK